MINLALLSKRYQARFRKATSTAHTSHIRLNPLPLLLHPRKQPKTARWSSPSSAFTLYQSRHHQPQLPMPVLSDSKLENARAEVSDLTPDGGHQENDKAKSPSKVATLGISKFTLFKASLRFHIISTALAEPNLSYLRPKPRYKRLLAEIALLGPTAMGLPGVRVTTLATSSSVVATMIYLEKPQKAPSA